MSLALTSAADRACPDLDRASSAPRRSLLGGLAAAAALVGLAARAGSPDTAPVSLRSPDAELLAGAADYARAAAEIRRLERLPEDVPDEAFEPLHERRYAAVEDAGELTAVSLAGLQAKAAIYVSEVDLRGTLDSSDIWDRLAYSLAKDLAGLKAGSGQP